MVQHLSAARAPIEYGAIRSSFHGVRAVTAAVIGIVAVLFAVIDSATYAIPYAIAAAIVFVDALYRRNRGDSAAPPLLIDITVIASAMVIGGASPSVQVAALAYGIAAISLLLPALPSFSLLLRALPCLSLLLRALPFFSLLFPALPRSSVLFRALPCFSSLLLLFFRRFGLVLLLDKVQLQIGDRALQNLALLRT